MKQLSVKKRTDFTATLLGIPVGETQCIDLVGREYTNYLTAKSRIQSRGLAAFEFRTEGPTLFVKRIK